MVFLFLAVIASPIGDERPIHLCDGARNPREGMVVHARGTLVLDQHGYLFVDADRRCAIPFTSRRDSAEADTLMGLSMKQLFHRIDAELSGRLSWDRGGRPWGLPPGYWLWEIDSIKRVRISKDTRAQFDADAKRWPKAIGVADPAAPDGQR